MDWPLLVEQLQDASCSNPVVSGRTLSPVHTAVRHHWLACNRQVHDPFQLQQLSRYLDRCNLDQADAVLQLLNLQLLHDCNDTFEQRNQTANQNKVLQQGSAWAKNLLEFGVLDQLAQLHLSRARSRPLFRVGLMSLVYFCFSSSVELHTQLLKDERGVQLVLVVVRSMRLAARTLPIMGRNVLPPSASAYTLVELCLACATAADMLRTPDVPDKVMSSLREECVTEGFGEAALRVLHGFGLFMKAGAEDWTLWSDQGPLRTQLVRMMQNLMIGMMDVYALQRASRPVADPGKLLRENFWELEVEGMGAVELLRPTLAALITEVLEDIPAPQGPWAHEHKALARVTLVQLLRLLILPSSLTVQLASDPSNVRRELQAFASLANSLHMHGFAPLAERLAKARWAPSQGSLLAFINSAGRLMLDLIECLEAIKRLGPFWLTVQPDTGRLTCSRSPNGPAMVTDKYSASLSPMLTECSAVFARLQKLSRAGLAVLDAAWAPGNLSWVRLPDYFELVYGGDISTLPFQWLPAASSAAKGGGAEGGGVAPSPQMAGMSLTTGGSLKTSSQSSQAPASGGPSAVGTPHNHHVAAALKGPSHPAGPATTAAAKRSGAVSAGRCAEGAASGGQVECSWCQAAASANLRMKRCGGCLEARYCSVTCQKAHWRKGHRDSCGSAAAAATPPPTAPKSSSTAPAGAKAASGRQVGTPSTAHQDAPATTAGAAAKSVAAAAAFPTGTGGAAKGASKPTAQAKTGPKPTSSTGQSRRGAPGGSRQPSNMDDDNCDYVDTEMVALLRDAKRRQEPGKPLSIDVNELSPDMRETFMMVANAEIAAEGLQGEAFDLAMAQALMDNVWATPGFRCPEGMTKEDMVKRMAAMRRALAGKTLDISDVQDCSSADIWGPDASKKL